MSQLESAEIRFVEQSIRREQLFFRLSMLGVFIGLILLAMAVLRWGSGEAGGSTFVMSILVLLNARQNLRQSKYARVLAQLYPGSVESESGNDG